MSARVVRSLVFPLRELPTSLEWLLSEFRLMVNKSIRFALDRDIRSLYRLTGAAYRGLAADHDVYKQYIPSAFEVALGLLKGHRRRIGKGRPTSVPYQRRLMLKAENQSYRLDRERGELRIPIRAGEHVKIRLPMSSWHESFLANRSWGLGSLTVTPHKVIIAIRRPAPKPYNPMGIIALDTNESSLDGVAARGETAVLARACFPDVRKIQAVHFSRRRRLSRKKAHDRRVRRCLLAREGCRERNRVGQRLHLVSKTLVRAARRLQAAIVLEDLTMLQGGGGSRRMRRRLSSWPRGELHRQIEYKALASGVPIIKVSPRGTSKACPACGETKGSRERVGRVFDCQCGWRMDRQLNAGLNILRTATACEKALARAVRFQPSALRHDVVIPLYDLQADLEVHGGSRAEVRSASVAATGS